MGAKRILINIFVTYGRSVISFVLSLFTARWILEALGEEDFGLYGVVGGVMFFVSLLNITQSTTVARFYAYSIGADEREIKGWFNSALSIHVILPAVLIPIGYFVGVYAFCNWLDIPENRLASCIWVFRLSLVTLMISIIAVPYSAMFVAYQYISQLVIFSFVHVFGIVAVSYALCFIDGDRLRWYAAMSFILNLTVYALQISVAHRKFSGCRVVVRQMFDKVKMWRMLKFSGIKLLGDFAWGVRNNGSAFVANIGIGSSANAALSVSNQLSTQASSLCNTISTAFVPAITTEEGAGRRDQMIQLSTRCCKFGAILLLLISVPLIAEIDFWLKVWLKTPPSGSSELCICMIVASLATYITNGYQIAIQAHGDIFKWQTLDALCHIVAIPVACLFLVLGFGTISIGFGFIASSILVSLLRLYFARKLLRISVWRWVKIVLLPISGVWVFCYGFVLLLRGFFSEGFLQFGIVGFASVLLITILSWVVVLDEDERLYVQKMRRIIMSRIGLT